VIKVGHHGSRTSSTTPFLAGYRPDLALVSVGRGNLFTHPAPEVIGRLRGVRADVLRTDRDGAIVLESDGRAVEVVTMAGRRLNVAAWQAVTRASKAPSW
jgi:competence protein ComEC